MISTAQDLISLRRQQEDDTTLFRIHYQQLDALNKQQPTAAHALLYRMVTNANYLDAYIAANSPSQYGKHEYQLITMISGDPESFRRIAGTLSTEQAVELGCRLPSVLFTLLAGLSQDGESTLGSKLDREMNFSQYAKLRQAEVKWHHFKTASNRIEKTLTDDQLLQSACENIISFNLLTNRTAEKLISLLFASPNPSESIKNIHLTYLSELSKNASFIDQLCASQDAHLIVVIANKHLKIATTLLKNDERIRTLVANHLSIETIFSVIEEEDDFLAALLLHYLDKNRLIAHLPNSKYNNIHTLLAAVANELPYTAKILRESDVIRAAIKNDTSVTTSAASNLPHPGARPPTLQ